MINIHNQSLFAIQALGLGGFNFLDIGCSGPGNSVCHPLLEHNCDGWFADIDHFDGWDGKNYHQLDATTADWSFIDKDINYVSIDVDTPAGNGVKVLEKLNWDWNIKVITIEHDVYRETFHGHIGSVELEKIPQKEFLQNKGFELVCEDVTFTDCDTGEEKPHEDWWVKHEYLENVRYIIGPNQNRMKLYEKILTNIGRTD